MNKRITWINTSNGQRDDAGNWESGEERFTIAPNYRHTVYPDSYTVRDRILGDSQNYDRVRDCKAWAERRVSGGKS